MDSDVKIPQNFDRDGNINFEDIHFSQNEINVLASISGKDRCRLFLRMCQERNRHTELPIFEVREVRNAFFGSFLLGAVTMGEYCGH